VSKASVSFEIRSIADLKASTNTLAPPDDEDWMQWSNWTWGGLWK
jgi:hypothetical protein